jgi:hypothetical protein
MQKWEIKAEVVHILKISFLAPAESSATHLWEIEDKKGETGLGRVTKLAEDGWELVSVTPINGGPAGMTHQLLFTFKRPLEKAV